MRYRMTPDCVYGADFETDHNGTDRAWICQWAISNGEKETYGRSLDSFQKAVCTIVQFNGSAIIYFHNLKFDLQFMKGVIKRWEHLGWAPKYILRQGSPVKIRLTNSDNLIEFRDSMKKIPMALKKVGKSIGLAKQESPRGFYQGWSEDIDYSNGSPDWCYIRIDARIVAKAMRNYHREGFDRSTMSGDAWQCLKQMIGTTDGNKHKQYYRWEYLFPQMSRDLDSRCRKAYFGGQNYSANKGINRTGRDGEPIYHEDVHNMYGGVDYYDRLPVGMPLLTSKMPTDPDAIYIRECRVKMFLKEGMPPVFQFKNGIDNLLEGWEHGTLVTDCKEWHDMSLTNVDIETYSKFYDFVFDRSYHEQYLVFNWKVGVLKPYLDQFTAQKESSKKGSVEYIRAKTMINAGAYGRFGLAPDGDDTELQWDDDLGDYDFKSVFNGEAMQDSYVPFAVFVCAWARRHLLDNVHACLMRYGADSVIHCDTDSVIHYGEPVETPITPHGEHVGTWGIESTPPVIIEAGFKRYVELRRYPIQSVDDLIGMACAGVPQQYDYTESYPVGMWVEILDDPTVILEDGRILGSAHYRIRSEWLRSLYVEHGQDPDDVDTLKLLPRKVKGGIILEGHTHTLNDNLIWRLRR